MLSPRVLLLIGTDCFPCSTVSGVIVDGSLPTGLARDALAVAESRLLGNVLGLKVIVRFKTF